MLLNDAYLPGALVLAHSLRDAGTVKQLAVLITPDSITAETATLLKTVYNHVIPVPRIQNAHSNNLQLIKRAELDSAFTKINLWSLTQYSKIVYLDADVVAYRAPDELFDIPAAFSAAPDVGWPDLFNTGVMVLSPNQNDYRALVTMAEKAISFDGADQGLINLHFRSNYNRISFTYNVTPASHYQYIPAYRHFKSSISMIHFIGPMKPWLQARDINDGDSVFSEMLGQWWSVYDRHYRNPTSIVAPTSRHEQRRHRRNPRGSDHHDTEDVSGQLVHIEAVKRCESFVEELSHLQQWPCDKVPGQKDSEHLHAGVQSAPHISQSPTPDVEKDFDPDTGKPTGFAQKGQKKALPRAVRTGHAHGTSHPFLETWDAQRHPPPQDAKPEAMNFPTQVYEMSRDPRPFIPPERYPSPPKNMWYEVPNDRPVSAELQPIFPWETRQPRPSRVFSSEPARPSALSTSNPPPSVPGLAMSPRPPLCADSLFSKSIKAEHENEHFMEPIVPAVVRDSQSWHSFSRTNTLDEIPEFGHYVRVFQTQCRAGVADLSPAGRAGQQQDLRFTNAAFSPQNLPVSPIMNSQTRHYSPGVLDADSQRGRQRSPANNGVVPQSDWICVHGNVWAPTDCFCDLNNVLRFHKRNRGTIPETGYTVARGTIGRHRGSKEDVSEAVYYKG
ncbi:glycosyltransferase family 8 protein [Sodiomyces alcalophilus JCM 7366]|uniref:glycosyltransferase family 8 protein n=1 Tax=Sodiomyces alcalophilus JCM 7366 TaxID=591952 RepID=UPI0039B46E92